MTLTFRPHASIYLCITFMTHACYNVIVLIPVNALQINGSARARRSQSRKKQLQELSSKRLPSRLPPLQTSLEDSTSGVANLLRKKLELDNSSGASAFVSVRDKDQEPGRRVRSHGTGGRTRRDDVGAGRDGDGTGHDDDRTGGGGGGEAGRNVGVATDTGNIGYDQEPVFIRTGIFKLDTETEGLPQGHVL